MYCWVHDLWLFFAIYFSVKSWFIYALCRWVMLCASCSKSWSFDYVLVFGNRCYSALVYTSRVGALQFGIRAMTACRKPFYWSMLSLVFEKNILYQNKWVMKTFLGILFTPYLVSLYLWVILPQFDLKRVTSFWRYQNLGSRGLGPTISTCPTCWYPLLLIYYKLVLHVGIFSRSIR